MKKEVRFNIELFKIKNYEDWYKHFLYFLIKYFFSSDNFSWMIKKEDFINKWIEKWFNKRFLENVYILWKKENQFLSEIELKSGEKCINIKSMFNKDKKQTLIVYIEPELMAKIIDLNTFRSLCYIIIASRPFILKKWIKNKEYFYKNTSRTITTIWTSFWNITKDVMSKRLQKAKEIFKDEFNITKRYSSMNFFWSAYMVQLSNLYSISWVRYKSYKDKSLKYKNEENKEFKKEYWFIKWKFIKSNVLTFWNKEKVVWFLPKEYYESLWKEIKKKVFEK